MKFQDIKDKQKLVGMYVLYESGNTWSECSRRIKSITKVTKTGFRITPNKNGNGEPYDIGIFDFNTGYQKGLTGRMHMGTISKCTLLSEDEANGLVAEWKRKRETKEMIEKIKNRLNDLSYEKLNQILKSIEG